MTSSPQKFGRYTLTNLIARGGMGEIYLASLEGVAGFEKQCVIKKIRPDLVNDDAFIERFLNEGRTLVALTHSNIVQIFDMGEVNGEYYLAMEYVAGADLRFLCRRLKHDQFIPIDIALAITHETLKGLSHAHTAVDRQKNPLGIVHRDISPSNILISENGEVKLIDFGIAKASTVESCSGLVQGKFAYMSPEQARGETLDARTDIFSMGVVLYEMLTNVRPFEGNSDLQSLEFVKTKDAKPISYFRQDVDPELEQIVALAMAKHREERYQSAEALDDVLSAYVKKRQQIVGQREIAAYFKPMMDPEITATQRPNDGIEGLLEEMMGAPAVHAPMTQTLLPAPQSTLGWAETQDIDARRMEATADIASAAKRITQSVIAKPQNAPNTNDLAFADTGAALPPLRDDEELTGTLAPNAAESANHEIQENAAIREPVENQQEIQENQANSDNNREEKQPVEVLSLSDLAVIQNPNALSEDVRQKIRHRRLVTRIKYALVGAGIALVVMSGMLFYHTLGEQTEQRENATENPAKDAPDAEIPVVKEVSQKTLPQKQNAFSQGVPFIFKTTPEQATLYVISGNYREMSPKRVVLLPGSDIEMAVQAPGFETCMLQVKFSAADKTVFESLMWKNCGSTASAYDAHNHQLDLSVSLIPIRAASTERKVQEDIQNPQSQAETAKSATPNADIQKPETPNADIQKPETPQLPSKSRPAASRPSIKAPVSIKRLVKTSRDATVTINGQKVHLPGEIEATTGTKLEIFPKVSGRTVAIPAVLTFKENMSDIAFCEAKIRIRESYAPGDPAPYQIADIDIDGQNVAKQTDFVALVLPCGKHRIEAKTQANGVTLKAVHEVELQPNQALSLPLMLSAP